MKNRVLDEIRKYTSQKLTNEYGYCGVADGDEIAMLNSDDGQGNDIKIIIKSVKE